MRIVQGLIWTAISININQKSWAIKNESASEIHRCYQTVCISLWGDWNTRPDDLNTLKDRRSRKVLKYIPYIWIVVVLLLSVLYNCFSLFKDRAVEMPLLNRKM